MIYNVSPEIEEYFLEKYKESNIKTVPGHWPKLNTKEDVDKFIKFLDSLEKSFNELFDEEE